MRDLPKPKKHLMIDLETLGSGPDAAIISCGVVMFTAPDGIVRDAEWFIRDPFNQGRKVDPKTLEWWKTQGALLDDHLTRASIDGMGLDQFAERLYDFVGAHREDVRAWSNGATFDLVILDHLFRSLGFDRPWHFTNERCYRTLKSIATDFGHFRPATRHDALSDARAQAMNVRSYLIANPEADR